MSSTYPVIKGSLLSSEQYTWNTADSVGRGASAVVFLGRHKVKGTVVAVKVFHDHVALGYKQDDLRELELLRCLDHPNIIHLLDIEKEMTSRKTVLVTEYCEGGSLHQMLDQPIYYYGLPETEYILVLTHVASGMQYLREKNVIHRDIKPGNIMRYLTEEGFSVYKLTDFGAARNLDEDESFQSLYGTEEYLYPGVYERAVLKLPTAQSFDAKVDLWSLGVTFYHTATGELPFQPYGGRQNKQTMFEIITEKESGVISGVQTFQNGPIQWKRDLPQTSPLSSGLKSIVVPLLAGLMEPDAARMISYDQFFRTVHSIQQKLTIMVFHFSRCENLAVYADNNSTFSGLQDLLASLTDIPACEQILLVGAQSLEEVVDPMSTLKEYPVHLLHDSIFLFQKEMSEATRLPRPEIPAFPEFSAYSNMDSDARLAHSCAARGELIKRFQQRVCEQQKRLMIGLLYFRQYVEGRLSATKPSHDFMHQLMSECELHFRTFFNMCTITKGILSTSSHRQEDIALLDAVLKDTIIRQVHQKASERMSEIEQYREVLVKRLDEVKLMTSKVTADCRELRCHEKVSHHMTVISGVQSRYRRDKSVKHQMSPHDENIHCFERQKLEDNCATMKSIFTDHCLTQLEMVYRKALHVCDSLTRCLTRVKKIEKNINSVLNCQRLLSQKLMKLSGAFNLQAIRVKESGFESGESNACLQRSSGDGASSQTPLEVPQWVESFFPEDSRPMSNQTQGLSQKLIDLQESLEFNSQLIRSLDDNALQSTGSLSRRLEALALVEFPDDHQKAKSSLETMFDQTPLLAMPPPQERYPDSRVAIQDLPAGNTSTQQGRYPIVSNSGTIQGLPAGNTSTQQQRYPIVSNSGTIQGLPAGNTSTQQQGYPIVSNSRTIQGLPAGNISTQQQRYPIVSYSRTIQGLPAGNTSTQQQRYPIVSNSGTIQGLPAGNTSTQQQRYPIVSNSGTIQGLPAGNISTQQQRYPIVSNSGTIQGLPAGNTLTQQGRYPINSMHGLLAGIKLTEQGMYSLCNTSETGNTLNQELTSTVGNNSETDGDPQALPAGVRLKAAVNPSPLQREESLGLDLMTVDDQAIDDLTIPYVQEASYHR